MANIKINDLQTAEFSELSDLELEGVVGGKRKITKAIGKIANAIGVVTVTIPF